MYGTICMINGTLFVMTMASLGAVIYSFMFRVATGNYARFVATLIIFAILLASRIISFFIERKLVPPSEREANDSDKGEFTFWALITAASLCIGFVIVSISSWAKGEVVWWVPIVFIVFYAISFYLFMHYCIRNAINCSEKF